MILFLLLYIYTASRLAAEAARATRGPWPVVMMRTSTRSTLVGKAPRHMYIMYTRTLIGIQWGAPWMFCSI